MVKNLAAMQETRVQPLGWEDSPGCDDHSSPHVSFNSGFLGVYAQQWDGWVIWQF